MESLKFAILEELVFESVRQYVHIWESIRFELELIESVERVQAECGATAAERAAVVDRYMDKAWKRLAAERARTAAEPLSLERPPSSAALTAGVERAARAGAIAATALGARARPAARPGRASSGPVRPGHAGARASAERG